MNLVEAAKYAKGRHGQNLAEVSLRAAAQRGALKATKKDGKWDVSRSELDKYLKSRPRWWKPGSSEKKLVERKAK
jgi:hypothetical protein